MPAKPRLLLLGGLTLVALGGAPCLAPESGYAQSSRVQSAMAMTDPVGSFAPMLERVIPAVVTILIVGETAKPVELKPREADGRLLPLSPSPKEPFRSGGSGVIVDAARGLILTNNHVIADALKIEVSLSDGRRMTARLIGRDIGTDVAVIAVDERNLPGLPLGDSDRSRVGDVVLAVGNPYGLEGTATLGIISALMRTSVGHEAFEDFMQIDAPINPGNSGGALVNVHGELIGINTAGPGEPGRAVGIGFAIPINMARTIVDELVANGTMRRGSSGLVVEDLSLDVMGKLGTKLTRGAHVTGVLPGSPAAAAGIAPGAIVTSVSGKPVRNAGEFETRIATVPLGRQIDVVVAKGATSQTYKLISSDIMRAPEEVLLPREYGSVSGGVIGELRPGNPLFGTVRGVQVLRVEPQSPAYWSGLDVGDVIVGLDDNAVRSADDLSRAINRASMTYRLRVQRNGVPAWMRASR